MFFNKDLSFETPATGEELDHSKINYVALFQQAQSGTALQRAMDAMQHPGARTEAPTGTPQMGYAIPVGFRSDR